jgi:hypothetical protein
MNFLKNMLSLFKDVFVTFKFGFEELGRIPLRMAPMSGSYKVGLAIVLAFYALFYSYSMFIMLEETYLVTALEVDAGSIMTAFHSLYDSFIYNMHNGYHSKYYGWSYLALNYWLILPLKLFDAIVPYDMTSTIHLAMRIILFVIGLCAVSLMYLLSFKISKNVFISIFAGLLIAFDPSAFYLQAFIHPESFGVAMSLAGVYYLLRYVDLPTEAPRTYRLGLLCLVLASLAKQLFFIAALPIMAMFYYIDWQRSGEKFFIYFCSKVFWKKIGYTASFALFVFFLVHPNAFIEVSSFYRSQLSTVMDHSNAALAVSMDESFRIWWTNIIQGSYLLVLSIISIPFVLLVSVVDKTRNKFYRVFASVNVVYPLVIALIVSCVSRLMVGNILYFYPILAFLILNAVIILTYLKDSKFSKFITIPIMAMIVAAMFTMFSVGVQKASELKELRSNYKESIAYKTYLYILNDLPPGTRLAHDHMAPKTKRSDHVYCHYWQDCSNKALVEKFNPSHLLFDMNYTHNGHIPESTQGLLDYAKEHNFVKVREFHSFKLIGGPITLTLFERQ